MGTWSVTTDQNATVEEPLTVDDAGAPVAIDATLIKRPEHGTVVIRASSDGYTRTRTSWDATPSPCR